MVYGSGEQGSCDIVTYNEKHTFIILCLGSGAEFLKTLEIF